MKLKYTFETMELDNKILAVPVGSSVSDFRGIIKMNETASRIIELLGREIAEDDIINTLAEEYDVSRDMLSEDVRKCISEFQAKGILE